MKTHLTLLGTKGIKCPGLKKVIPSDVWDQQILPFYRDDDPMPESDIYPKSPERKRGEFKNVKLKRNKKETS